MADNVLSKVALSRRSWTRRSARDSHTDVATVPVLSVGGYARADGGPPAFGSASHQFTPASSLETLPPVSLSNLDGDPAPLAAGQGKVLLVNIWATWCQSCLTDLPLLERFHEAVGDRVDVAAISIDKADQGLVRRYLKMISIHSVPIYLDPDERLASSSSESPAPLPIFGLPITYLITPSGRIAGYVSGISDWLTQDARKLLAYYASA